MRSLYRTHLKKEFRENRSLLIGLFVIVVIACFAIALTIERAKRPTPDAPAFSTLCAMALVILTLGPETLGREAARNRPAAIARLPGGLLRPFLARLTLYLSALGFFAAIAFLLEIACLYLIVTRPIEIASLYSHRTWLGIAGFAAILALVPSTWLKQTMLGAPAGLILGGSLVGAWMVFPVPSKALLQFFGEQRSTLITIVVFAALIAAWRGFRALHRHGGGRSAAAFSGLAAFYLLTSPVVAYGAYRAFDWAEFPAGGKDCIIEEMIPIANGERILARMSRDRGDTYPGFVAEIDLTKHTVTPIARDAFLGAIEMRDQRMEWRWRLMSRIEGDDYRTSLIDTTTGSILDLTSNRAPGAPFPTELSNALRENSTLTWSGKRCWLERRKLMVDGVDGPEVVREFADQDFVSTYFSAGDLGLVIRTSDPTRGKWYFLFTESGLEVPFDGATENLRYALSDGRILLRGTRPHRYVLRDASGTLTPLPAIHPGEEIVARIDDRRVLVTRYSMKGDNPIVVVDIESGDRQPVCFEDGSPAVARSVSEAQYVLDATGRSTPIVRIADRDTRLARFDDATSTLMRAKPPIGFETMSITYDGALVLDPSNREIRRIEFGTDRCDVLFPFATSLDQTAR